ALPLLGFFTWKFSQVRFGGQLAMSAILVLSSASLVCAGYAAAGIYMTGVQMIGWLILGLLLLLSLVMAIFQGIELVEVIWRRHWRREITPQMARAAAARERSWPKVSLHLAMCTA